MDIFEEKGGEGDVRDYSEQEAGLGEAGPSGDPFEDNEEHLTKRYPNLWRWLGRHRSAETVKVKKSSARPL